MATSNEKALSALNDLTQICKDGQKGFATAAEGVKDPELQTLFSQYANQRAQFVQELQQQVIALGGQPEDSGTVAGAAHRAWVDLKAAITGKDDHAIVAECERGEDVAKEMYEKALNSSDLPGTLLSLIQAQYAQIKEAHDRVRTIRDSVTA
jgi:uncharacterized protein (TIGR02284 family)